jgi:hypothetical protein
MKLVQSYLCGKGELSRLIAVEKPCTPTSFKCRVIYSTEKSKFVEWQAKNEVDHCTRPARHFAEKQVRKGYYLQSATNRN